MRAWLMAILVVGGVLAGCAGTDEETTGSGSEAVLYHGARVWTADDAMPWGEAFVVEDGDFAAVGGLQELRAAFPGAEEVVLDGALVLPGFHDTHNHFLRSALSAEPVEGNPYAPWPPEWDPVEGPLGQQQTAVGHVGNYMVINADRMQGGGLPKPPHAEVAEMADGHAHVHGVDAMTDVGPWQEMGASYPNLALAQRTAASMGITSHVEAGAPLASLDALQTLAGDGALKARYNLYVFPEDLDATLERGLTLGDGTEQARLLGLKIYSDGWLGPRTAAMREMYEDRPHTGFSFYTQEELDDWVLRAHQGGLKITAHSIGDRATEVMLTAYERAVVAPCEGQTVCGDPRFSLEHVQLVGDDLLGRMVGLGLVPSIQMSFATSDSHWAEDALGEDRMEDAYRWQDMLGAGLTLGASSDWPIEALPPLWGIHRIVHRQEVDTSLPEPFMPEQAVTLEQALRMVTIDAAYLEHREHEVGSITAGKFADFVVLDRDIFAVPGEIADAQVQMTVVGGEATYAVDGHDGHA